MNRRSFLRALSALPLLGFLKPNQATSALVPPPLNSAEARIVKELNRRLSIHDKVRRNLRYTPVANLRYQQQLSIPFSNIENYRNDLRLVFDHPSDFYNHPEWSKEYARVEKEYPNGVPFKPIEVMENIDG